MAESEATPARRALSSDDFNFAGTAESVAVFKFGIRCGLGLEPPRTATQALSQPEAQAASAAAGAGSDLLPLARARLCPRPDCTQTLTHRTGCFSESADSLLRLRVTVRGSPGPRLPQAVLRLLASPQCHWH